MPHYQPFLQTLRTELSRVPGDALAQALAVCRLKRAVQAAKPFAPVSAVAVPKPTPESASLTLEFANGITLRITNRYAQAAGGSVLLSVSHYGRPQVARVVECRWLADSIVAMLQSTV